MLDKKYNVVKHPLAPFYFLNNPEENQPIIIILNKF